MRIGIQIVVEAFERICSNGANEGKFAMVTPVAAETGRGCR